MKTKLNIALEGTCSGDVVGGLLSWTVESLQALLFLKGGKVAIDTKINKKDFETLEKITPVAQILIDWSVMELKDLRISSPAVLESMGKTLWEVYDSIGEKLSNIEETQ